MIGLFEQTAKSFLAIDAADRAAALFEATRAMPLRLIASNSTEPYLERAFVGESDGCFVYLHRFVSGDGDRDVHNPPWGRAESVILCGEYSETRREGLNGAETSHRWVAGDLNVIHGTTLHRITETAPETWSLFAHSAWIQDWGFKSEGYGIERRQSEPDGHHRFWWARSSAFEDHKFRAPFPYVKNHAGRPPCAVALTETSLLLGCGS